MVKREDIFMNVINKNLHYVGVNDHQVDLFEGQYIVPNGMAYNSYVIMDKKVAVIDTVDRNFTHEWLDNIKNVLGDRKPDYLIIQHMEPDHSANIPQFLNIYPDTIVVGNEKTFKMMYQFFNGLQIKNKLVVKDMDTLSLGDHNLTFVFAPMVHWPEVMVTYDSYIKTLFSADGFGKFGALDVEEEWDCEARRYYIGIVGKYGMQLQNLLAKAKTLDIEMICPLHGPVLDKDLGHYLHLYDVWSSYVPEDDGILVAYTSVYGNTKAAVMKFVEKLKEKGAPKVSVMDLARDDMAEAVEDAFRYSKLVLATTTYNSDIFPFMRTFIDHLTERNYQNRTVGFIENGTWAPMAARVMKDMLKNSKNLKLLEPVVTVRSALGEESNKQLDELVDALTSEYQEIETKEGPKTDLTSLFSIDYGLYVITSNDGNKDNGIVVNAVTQITNTPNRVAVTINKDSYSHHVIKQKGIMNINCLTVDTPFSVFENFGMQSGRNVDKFVNFPFKRSANGLPVLSKYSNAFISLKVESYIDFGTHGMFVCSITEAKVLSNDKTMAYSYYYSNVKPKPVADGRKGFVCKVCGYVYEGDTLPEDIVCPLCRHGAIDFEPLE